MCCKSIVKQCEHAQGKLSVPRAWLRVPLAFCHAPRCQLDAHQAVFGVVLWPSVDPRKAWPDMSPECFTVKLRDSVLGDYGLVAAIKWEDLRLEPEFADTPTQQQGESDCTFRYRVEMWATYAH